MDAYDALRVLVKQGGVVRCSTDHPAGDFRILQVSSGFHVQIRICRNGNWQAWGTLAHLWRHFIVQRMEHSHTGIFTQVRPGNRASVGFSNRVSSPRWLYGVMRKSFEWRTFDMFDALRVMVVDRAEVRIYDKANAFHMFYSAELDRIGHQPADRSLSLRPYYMDILSFIRRHINDGFVQTTKAGQARTRLEYCE